MVKLKVIEGFKKEEPNYPLLYTNAYIKTLKKLADRPIDIEKIDIDSKRKLIWSGVKMINTWAYEIEDYKTAHRILGIISMINSLVGTLTPLELQSIFSITKDYDGGKYQMIDYFYTRKFIEEFGLNRIIGEEVSRFYMEYHNLDIRIFAVRTMSVMSVIRRAEGGKGIMEEFIEEQNITTYTKTRDRAGKEFLKNNQTGELIKVKKRRPNHLTVIK